MAQWFVEGLPAIPHLGLEAFHICGDPLFENDHGDVEAALRIVDGLSPRQGLGGGGLGVALGEGRFGILFEPAVLEAVDPVGGVGCLVIGAGPAMDHC